MKKLFNGFLCTLVLFVVSCSNSEIAVQNAKQNELLEFVNSNLKESNLKITSVNQFRLDNYDNYKSKLSNSGVTVAKKTASIESYLEPNSLQIQTTEGTYNVHALPHNQATATIFIEGVSGKLVETLDINISDYDPVTDTHKITWTVRNSNSASKLNFSKDCKTGAAQVGAAGRIISFGSFLGCVPCAFIGGAISAIGAAGYIACSINR